LWPDTEMEPMGFLKVTMGACFTKGICGGEGRVGPGGEGHEARMWRVGRKGGRQCAAAAQNSRQVTAHDG